MNGVSHMLPFVIGGGILDRAFLYLTLELQQQMYLEPGQRLPGF